jgi:6-phosphogluconolactonase
MSSVPRFPLVAALLALGLALGLAAPASAQEPRDGGNAWVFVGTYTDGASKGVYRFDLDLSTGKPSDPVLAAESTSPSFLALGSGGRYLFAVNEVNRVNGQPGGVVTAFAVDPQTGGLTLINQQSSRGEGPCHLVVDKAGENVLVANYGGGSTAVLPVGQDGKLGPASGFVQHKGSSVNPGRQKGPHAHAVALDAANWFAFVADLGLDKVLIYRFDAAKGTIEPNDPASAPVAAGAGPRHFAFHPTGKFAYAINELNSTVTAFSYDPSRGALAEIQSVPTLPEGFRGTNHPAEIQVHPNGRFVYGSNRGHNSIAVFEVDPSTGKLDPLGHQSQGIKNPRNFAIDPTGKWLLVANQDADTVLVFKIDPAKGIPGPTGNVVKVPKPVCLEFIRLPRP